MGEARSAALLTRSGGTVRSYVPVEQMPATTINVVAEQEHYVLISNGQYCTLAERRAGKFYPLCSGVRHGVELDDEGMAQLVRRSGAYSELEGRRRLADVAGQWRELFEHVR